MTMVLDTCMWNGWNTWCQYSRLQRLRVRSARIQYHLQDHASHAAGITSNYATRWPGKQTSNTVCLNHVSCEQTGITNWALLANLINIEVTMTIFRKSR
jgi:hypothetical protein